MNQGEFNKLLKESGLPKEIIQKLDLMERVINDHEERTRTLEARITILAKKSE